MELNRPLRQDLGKDYLSVIIKAMSHVISNAERQVISQR